MRNAAAAFTVIVLLVVGCLLITIFTILDDENKEDDDNTVIEVADDNDNPTAVVVTRIATSSVPTAIPGNVTTNLAQPTVFVPTPAVNTTINNNTTTTTNTTTCALQTGWVVYTVQDGDILANIAVATGTTLDTLVAANCLSNPDAIYAGQQLYVPTTPVGETGVTVTDLGAGGGSTTTTTTTTTGTSPLAIDPALAFQNNTYTLDGGQGVRITWTQLPLNAEEVAFFFTPAGSATRALITTDGDLSDGAVVSWTVPDTASGTVHAVATLIDGTEVASAAYNVITQ